LLQFNSVRFVGLLLASTGLRLALTVIRRLVCVSHNVNTSEKRLDSLLGLDTDLHEVAVGQVQELRTVDEVVLQGLCQTGVGVECLEENVDLE